MDTTGAGVMEKIGIGGTINGYGVLVLGDVVVVERDGETVTRRTVEGLGRFVVGAGDLNLGWAELPDIEVLYLYNAEDGGFGYAVNLQDPGCDEWGYAPFAP